MIRLFDTFDGKVRFEHVLSVAKAYLRRGDETTAWEAVRVNWADWAPVDRAQTAPLVLFIDAALANLVTRDRAIEFVHLPRATYLTTILNNLGPNRVNMRPRGKGCFWFHHGSAWFRCGGRLRE
jgi:hypothetical protein